jgi:hypothetical protein
VGDWPRSRLRTPQRHSLSTYITLAGERRFTIGCGPTQVSNRWRLRQSGPEFAAAAIWIRGGVYGN